MIRKEFQTRCGTIRYFTNEFVPDRITAVFLPGLTADHTLFERQIEYFGDRLNVFVWDAPAHGQSRPFDLNFDLDDKAAWLKEILDRENIRYPVIVGQSMGGYVGQVFEELFPGRICGFIAIDSAPLQRSYMTAIEIWMLEHVEPIYRCYPWKALLDAGSKGTAATPYGRQLMRDMMMAYNEDPGEYARLAGHGYRLLAKAAKADRPYRITCPALLICGAKDRAGSTKAYNKKWHARTGLPIEWIPDAGHNSNSDNPEIVNRLIERMIADIEIPAEKNETDREYICGDELK